MVAPTGFKLKFEKTDKPQFAVQILIMARSLREVQVELLTQLRSVGLSRAFKASLLREVAQRIVLNAETEGVTS